MTLTTRLKAKRAVFNCSIHFFYPPSCPNPLPWPPSDHRANLKHQIPVDYHCHPKALHFCPTHWSPASPKQGGRSPRPLALTAVEQRHAANLICPKELLPNVGFNLTHIGLHYIASPASLHGLHQLHLHLMHRLHHLHRLHPFSIIKFIYVTLTYVIWIHLMSSTSTSSRSYTSSTAISSTSVQRLHIFLQFFTI